MKNARIKSSVKAAADPFRSKKGADIPLILLFISINLIVLTNALLHDPGIQYDGDAHMNYVQTLSNFQLPGPEDSYEFFSPPLPYLIPALVGTAGAGLSAAMKTGQMTNVLLSAGLTFFIVKICDLLKGGIFLKRTVLIFLGILPVYYRTFAFVRGEPCVVFFATVLAYLTLKMILEKRLTVAGGLTAGTVMGLCALSRQWGIFIFPAFFLVTSFLWLRAPGTRWRTAKAASLSLLMICAVAGWFYWSLYSEYGDVTAFNREPAGRFSFGSQPASFYMDLCPKRLFTDPVRPAFPNRLLPILYSDTWGDYWGFFVVYGKDIRSLRHLDGLDLSRIFPRRHTPYWLKTNYPGIGAYLGRVNMVSLIPSALTAASLLWGTAVLFGAGKPSSAVKGVYLFLQAAVLFPAAGYLWFLIMYPNPGKGDTIKATYLIHVFPFIALLSALFLDRVRENRPLAVRFLLILLGLCFIHNLPVLFTHY